MKLCCGLDALERRDSHVDDVGFFGGVDRLRSPIKPRPPRDAHHAEWRRPTFGCKHRHRFRSGADRCREMIPIEQEDLGEELGNGA